MSVDKQITGKSVELSNVTKRFGDVVAVRDISFRVNAGDFCTLLGPSGSGKTTLLKIIAGFEKPDAGRILIDGTDVTGMPVSKRKIGMVFQNYALFPHMTVFTNIAFPLQMRKMGKDQIDQRVQKVLEVVDLPGYGDRYPRMLSGGQQQRVALARAMVFDPDILLMDEPLGALDKNLRQNLQVELKKLHRKLGATIIYVTHDQEEAMHMSDTVIVTNDGHIEQTGTAKELYNRPENVFVAGFLGECNLLAGEVVGPSANGLVCVELQCGFEVCIQPGSAAVNSGAKVKVGIRPEHLHPKPEIQDSHNRLQARIEEVIFSGNSYKLYLQIGSESLISLLPNRKDSHALTPGEKITVGFDPAEAFLLSIE